MIMPDKRVIYRVMCVIGALVVLGALTYLVYYTNGRYAEVSLVVQQMQVEHEEMRAQLSDPVRIHENVVAGHEVWRPIQERVKDSVVQVVSQCSEIDICQPYKTPAQYTAYGSGFFVNEDGEIITNAHVVDKARLVWIHIPSFGKRLIDTEVVGIAPERDLALLRVSPKSLELIRTELGGVPFLPLGDSDKVRRADEVMALGYPLCQHSLKSTTGVISGKESSLIQMSAAINPGNSGGPLLNIYGEVIGINTCNIPDAQNVGYIIQVNELKAILPDLRKTKILHRPMLGIWYNPATTDALVDFLGNPRPGGCYIAEVIKNSPLAKAGIKRGDMLYVANGYKIDMFGDMNVPWSEDKISVVDFVSRLLLGDKIKLVLYRRGKRMEVTVTLAQSEQPNVRKVFPVFEELDYETIGGMVIMPLTINHIAALVNRAPGLTVYTEPKKQDDQVLVIAHVFQTSYLARMQIMIEGATINEVNGVRVSTLAEFRQAVKKSLETGFLTLRVSDNIAHISDHVFVVLPFEKVLEEEPRLSAEHRYPLSHLAKEMVELRNPPAEGKGQAAPKLAEQGMTAALSA